MKTLQSKLPDVGTTIFTTMSALAQKHGAINLSQGFPDFSSSPKLIDLVAHHMRMGHNQYAPMAGLPALREALSHKIMLTYGYEPDPETCILVTAGATQGLFTTIQALIGPGDEVIYLEPAYDAYRPAIQLAGGQAVSYSMSAPDYQVDWEDIASLVSSRTRAIIINSPHNPTGTLLHAEDLLALTNLANQHDLIVISDEVYEHITFDGQVHESVLRYPDLRHRAVACFSFGKTFHNTGWKLGYTVAPEWLMEEILKVHQFNVFSVHSPSQYAFAEYLKNSSTYLNIAPFFQEKRDFFREAMEGSRLKPLGCQGTYFMLFDYSDISSEPDTKFARKLTVEEGVAAIPVSVFHRDGQDDKVVRFCFAKSEETLDSAAHRLRNI